MFPRSFASAAAISLVIPLMAGADTVYISDPSLSAIYGVSSDSPPGTKPVLVSGLVAPEFSRAAVVSPQEVLFSTPAGDELRSFNLSTGAISPIDTVARASWR